MKINQLCSILTYKEAAPCAHAHAPSAGWMEDVDEGGRELRQSRLYFMRACLR